MKIIKGIAYFVSAVLLSFVVELYLVSFVDALDFSNFRFFLPWHFVVAIFSALFGSSFLFVLIFFDFRLFKTFPVVLLVVSLLLFLVILFFDPNGVLNKFLD